MHQETVQRLYTAVRSGDLYLIRELLAAIRHEPMFKSELTECLHIGIKAKQVSRFLQLFEGGMGTFCGRDLLFLAG